MFSADGKFHLKSMRQMLELSPVSRQPFETFKIISCFGMLGYHVSLAFDNFPDVPNWHSVSDDMVSVWSRLVSEIPFTWTTRGQMLEIDLRSTVRSIYQLAKLIRQADRGVPVTERGPQVWVPVVNHLNSHALEISRITPEQAERWETFLYQDHQLLLTVPQDRETVYLSEIREREEAKTRRKARTTPALEIAEPWADSDAECSICRDKLENGVKLNECGHLYCEACIENWMHKGQGANNRCPMCRAGIIPPIYRYR